MRPLAVAALTALVTSGLLPLGAPGAAARAVPPQCQGVAIVVDEGDLAASGERTGAVYCEKTTGPALDVLRAAGAKIEGTASMGLAFVCRVNGRPAVDELIALPDGSTRTETCRRTPPANAYWSLWTASEGGGWTYATAGIGDIELAKGDLIALVYSVARQQGLEPAIPVDEVYINALPGGWESSWYEPAEPPEHRPLSGPVVVGAALLMLLLVTAAVLARRRRHPR